LSIKEASCKSKKKEFLESYKKTNAIARLTAAFKKATALKDFVVDNIP
jgi:hypothetical protein